MKKLLIMILMVAILVSGCGGKKSEETDVEKAKPAADASATEEPAEEPESDTRPIAIMIDNDNGDARPHAGIDDAYIIYEAYVEGSATRMMALFKDA
ncbi:MAG: DUF3048 domain-containing protein, partial [Clostridia bacterium]|nr:DUF3048 domain-containing protein [Clostridia bacterium]